MPGTTALDALVSIQETDRHFFSSIRLLDPRSRQAAVTEHLRNSNNALALVRTFMANTPSSSDRQNIVMTIPLGDLINAGESMMGTFEDVPIIPTSQQVSVGTEMHVRLPADSTCSICQEGLVDATRIRRCGHCFHPQCISQWFSMNPRCPMCRVDIRDTTTADRVNLLHRHGMNTITTRDDDSSVYSDEEPEMGL